MQIDIDPLPMPGDESVRTVVAYLGERAARYGGDVSDMLDRTPVELWDSPTEIMAFWDSRDLSHVMPQSEFPELADVWDNIIAEPFEINRGRGANIMTVGEREYAQIINDVDADIIDATHMDDSAEFLHDLIESIA